MTKFPQTPKPNKGNNLPKGVFPPKHPSCAHEVAKIYTKK